jgi:predicted PurR-regulated permease PerM
MGWLRKLMFIGKRWFLILLVVGLLIGLVVLFASMKRQNQILNQAVKQYEEIIKQKETQIQQLQERLEALQKEQVLRERKITILKKQKEQIQKPKSTEDLIKAFKELGYDARVN